MESLLSISKYKNSIKSDILENHMADKTNLGVSLSHRYKQLLHSEKYYDCIFHVGDRNIKCHKLILSTASPVFEAMFYGPICEKQLAIEILDISGDIFALMLEYIYAGTINLNQLTLEQIIELYYCAEKYFLNELLNNCLLKIAEKLRFSNILPAMELSVCMNFDNLLQVCMTFFLRCCLSEPQFMIYIKRHYMHVSKKCIKAIIDANQQNKKSLLWFVYEWCQQECDELGLDHTKRDIIINELHLEESICELHNTECCCVIKPQARNCHTIERSYYKACRPYTIDNNTNEWKTIIKSDRFISLHGIIMHSRLMPTNNVTINGTELRCPAIRTYPNEYRENLIVEIRKHIKASNEQNDENHDDDDDDDTDLWVWQHQVINETVKYNCDFNIQWEEGIILAPDIEYEIRLIWKSNSYRAEYPCSLQSNIIDGVEFCDENFNNNGSIIKAIRIIDLV